MTVAEYLNPDPDAFRAHMRERPSRALVSKITTENEAVARLVSDGDYLVYDCNYLQRGPASLLREIIRQRKRRLWIGAKFTYVDLALLLAAEAVAKVDVGFFSPRGPIFTRAAESGVQFCEYSNAIMTLRLRAGAQGLSFLPVRSFGGTDGYRASGARTISDPYTGRPTVVVPALNPDVAIIHVHEADEFGNARVFGTGIAHVESALASRKVILSTERIVTSEELRRNPGLTAIPWFAVDAVTISPFGAYPGSCQGLYSTDAAHVEELYAHMRADTIGDYMDKWIFNVADQQELLEQVGEEGLSYIRDREIISEGYSA